MRILKALVSLVLLLVVLSAAAGAGGWFWFKSEVDKPGPLAEETLFEVRPGEPLASVASRLETDGIIQNARLLRLHARLEGEEAAIKTGEYVLAPAISIAGVLDRLVEGRVVQYSLTIPEGLTTAQILRLVEADERLEGPLPDPLPAEGELLPETYAFTRGTTRVQFLQRLAAAQDSLMESVWPERSEGLPITTPEEALILASIVQKEAAGHAEFGNVASVFINRLERGMRLETDPTVHYGVNGGEPLYNTRGERRTLYRSELDRDTPYNTYTREGLPPTPIANPGADAIRAVLNPPETEYLFFVADGRGGTVFTSNYRDHNRAVQAYRAYEAAEIARERSN